MNKLFPKTTVGLIGDNLDFQQRAEQAVFRNVGCTVHHIQVLKEGRKMSGKYTKTFYIEFIYYEKAFDFVLTAAAPEVMTDQEIEETYRSLIFQST